uniref:Uncharacterized protein n=1 Tax=Nothobranchius furzeri TaxID=105023 RepID=A0A8C6NLX8_NOTFU
MSYDVATAALGRTDRGELIFEKEGVYLHTNAKRSNQETSIPGFIRVVERERDDILVVSSSVLVDGPLHEATTSQQNIAVASSGEKNT